MYAKSELKVIIYHFMFFNMLKYIEKVLICSDLKFSDMSKKAPQSGAKKA